MFYFSPLQTVTLILTAIILAFTANFVFQSSSTTTASDNKPMPAAATVAKESLKTAMSTLKHAKIVPRPSSTRGHADHGWLNTYHSFSFASWQDSRFDSFGSLRVLNEDRVAPNNGFPTHPHRDFEIFSYIISGELTHRDSMQRKGAESSDKNKFYRMKRGDVQFTTGGTGIAHSEQNEHDRDWVHFLQIWALPWKKGLTPTYHTSTFSTADKSEKFINIITPLKAGRTATAEQETAAVAAKEGTIPVHADLVFSAGIIAPGKTFSYQVGGDGEGIVQSKLDRKIYVHFPMTKGGKAKIRIDGRDDAVLKEGDGAFVSAVSVGDKLSFESVGDAEAEVVVVDSN